MSIVIDCDSHVMEPADLWQRYLEPRFRDRAIRIERRDGVEHLIIGEVSVLSNVLAGLGGAHLPRDRGVFSGTLSYADGCEPASYDPHRPRGAAGRLGRRPRRALSHHRHPALPDRRPGARIAYCRAYNRWQREFFEADARPRGADRAGQLARRREAVA